MPRRLLRGVVNAAAARRHPSARGHQIGRRLARPAREIIRASGVEKLDMRPSNIERMASNNVVKG